MRQPTDENVHRTIPALPGSPRVQEVLTEARVWRLERGWFGPVVSQFELAMFLVDTFTLHPTATIREVMAQLGSSPAMQTNRFQHWCEDPVCVCGSWLFDSYDPLEVLAFLLDMRGCDPFPVAERTHDDRFSLWEDERDAHQENHERDAEARRIDISSAVTA